LNGVKSALNSRIRAIKGKQFLKWAIGGVCGKLLMEKRQMPWRVSKNWQSQGIFGFKREMSGVMGTG
jgi:hypothetical protein